MEKITISLTSSQIERLSGIVEAMNTTNNPNGIVWNIDDALISAIIAVTSELERTNGLYISPEL